MEPNMTKNSIKSEEKATRKGAQIPDQFRAHFFLVQEAILSKKGVKPEPKS